MNVVDRLLIREAIDALELDLARAREREPHNVEFLRFEIERLESLLGAKAAPQPHDGPSASASS